MSIYHDKTIQQELILFQIVNMKLKTKRMNTLAEMLTSCLTSKRGRKIFLIFLPDSVTLPDRDLVFRIETIYIE